MTLRADEIVTVLDRRQVRYVVIGGLGAVLHGSPIVTQDEDKETANREKDRAVLPRLRLHSRMLREKARSRDDSSR